MKKNCTNFNSMFDYIFDSYNKYNYNNLFYSYNKQLESDILYEKLKEKILSLNYSKKEVSTILEEIIKQGLMSYARTNNIDNIYSIKIDSKQNKLLDTDFFKIVNNFHIILVDICNLFNVDKKNINVDIISATPGCFDIKLGINIENLDVNLLKISNTKTDEMTKKFVQKATGHDISEYDLFINLIKDCITGLITKNEPYDNYIDLKASFKAKKVIYKTIKKLDCDAYFDGTKMDIIV